MNKIIYFVIINIDKNNNTRELTVNEMLKAMCVVSANDYDVQFRHMWKTLKYQGFIFSKMLKIKIYLYYRHLKLPLW